ncbi:MAG: superoxide dismutase [Acidilobaceae archaeon]|nr:superoxide dismutase [Aigarchaeota archaeon]MCS7107767.1 superoxide dismutase [Acidilobaceae archaeon]MCX8203732.1 superoxide dismutase [Nitrososphaeria archaeon]MDW8043737.1 superoxide dismutase [Nitrososphaerota archaeon]
MKRYELPQLPYAYNALEPYIIEEIMRLHHTKHHQAYVNGANAALEKIEKHAKGEAQVDVRAVLRDLSFNLDGHKLHSIFWPNMAPAGKGGGKPGGAVADKIDLQFGSFENFKRLFSDAAKTVEGVGWALLLYDPEIDALVLTQIEKQNLMHLAELPILLSLDVWEHAYYLQYKNDRASYVDNWWNVVNWDDVERRLSKVRSR